MIRFQDVLQLYADYYFNLGLNVSCINGISSYEENLSEHFFKCPYHKWQHLTIERQLLPEMREYNWDNATGVGFILGYNNIRCLDFDGVNNFSLIHVCLEILGLPSNYQWVSLTGSGQGFHIFIEAEEHNIKKFDTRTKAFAPFGFYSQIFKRLELRWKNHIVAPPSRHISSMHYKFWDKAVPDTPIVNVSIEKVYNLIIRLCTEELCKGLTNRQLFFSLNRPYKLIEPSFSSFPSLINDVMQSSDYQYNINKEITEQMDQLPFLTPSESLLNYIDSTDVYKDGDNFKLKAKEENFWFDENEFKKESTRYLIIDTETTGLNVDRDTENCARIIQIAWIAYNYYPGIIEERNFLIKPNNFKIPENVTKINHITNSFASQFGVEIKDVLNELKVLLQHTVYIIGHNIDFDFSVIQNEFFLNNIPLPNKQLIRICTMKSSVNFCQLPSYSGYKYPTLIELSNKLFNTYVKESHNAMDDVHITADCYFRLRDLGIVES